MFCHDDSGKFALPSIELLQHSSPPGMPGMIARSVLSLCHNVNAEIRLNFRNSRASPKSDYCHKQYFYLCILL